MKNRSACCLEGKIMSCKSGHFESSDTMRRPSGSVFGRSLSRRSLLGAGALLSLAAIAHPTEHAYAWSSWTNATSAALKNIGMGDCVHEDLVQISYARLLRNHANDTATESLLNPWAGTIDPSDAQYATIAGDIVDRGEGSTFVDADDLALRLFRENLAYLRIGSFWNDAAANTVADFGLSCYNANSVPEFSGNDHYEGAWDVGQHIWETNEKNKESWINGNDALVQFTMNDRNNFIHGMLSSTASHSAHLKQSEIKQFALQWLGVAYEYARTGQVMATSDVTQEQAEKIFKGFIDTYDQLDNDAHDMCVSLKVSNSEASRNLPHRRLRLRALGMMCHTLEDFWCPAHTCRTYHEGGGVPQNSILAFSNYKMQNGSRPPMLGYHIPFDRYATSDAKNSTNWREALTRGSGEYKGTEKLANVLDDSMSCLDEANTYFNTLGMNETITCITQLFEFMYQGTAWDDGVRRWVDEDIMPTFFDDNGQSYVCDAGRRSLYTPTFVIGPVKTLKRPYRKVGLSANYDEILAAAKSYDAWQKGAHLFYSGKYNTTHSKYITSGNEGDSIWDDATGESRLIDFANKVHEGYSGLSSDKQKELLARIGCNGCHDMVKALDMVRGMLQEFNIDLRGSLRPDSDEVISKLKEASAFFESGLKGQDASLAAQAETTGGLLAAQLAYADENDEKYVTADMAIEDYTILDDGSYLIAVRDADSLETSIMSAPAGTPGTEILKEGLAVLSITYILNTEFEDDLDYCYVITEIDYSEMEEDVFLVTGTVEAVSADTKTLILDLNGITEFVMTIQDSVTTIPEVGAYICARYASGESGLELVEYDELDAPGEIKVATYPVELVAGSRMLLLTNEGESGEAEGYRDYLEIYYGSTDVYSVPQEGETVTVYYHDEAYGDITDVDEKALTSAAAAEDSVDLSAQSEDDLNDSPTPGYLELGDRYDNLNYGNEVFHVANVIAEPDEGVPAVIPAGSGSSSSQSSASSSTAAATTVPKTGTTSSTSSTSAKSTAKTNDTIGGFAGVLSVAALASSALAAYSARRLANEKGDSEEE